MVVYFFETQRGPAPYTRRREMQRSNGGMSISSGSGGASGMTRRPRRLTPLPWPIPRAAGSGSMCLKKSSSWAWSAAGSATASRNSALLPARKRCHPVVHALFSSQRSVTARAVLSAEGWRRHALFMAKPSKEPSRMERARVALACAWMQLLKLRKTATSQGCK